MPKITTLLKKTIVERAKGCCEYCHSQAKFPTQAFSVEHIKPQSKGGKTTQDNFSRSQTEFGNAFLDAPRRIKTKINFRLAFSSSQTEFGKE